MVLHAVVSVAVCAGVSGMGDACSRRLYSEAFSGIFSDPSVKTSKIILALVS